MKRNIGQARDERRENDWQEVVSDAEDANEKEGNKEDAETGKAEKDSTFGIVDNSTVSDLESQRTGSSILIQLGTWGTSLISLLGVTPTSVALTSNRGDQTLMGCRVNFGLHISIIT